MKIVTDDNTSFMEPMAEQAILEYAEYVVSQMDDKEVITKEGMDFITRGDNIPCEADQDTIMALVEELYNGTKDTNTEAAANSEAGEDTEPASEEKAEGYPHPTDEVADSEAVVTTEVE